MQTDASIQEAGSLFLKGLDAEARGLVEDARQIYRRSLAIDGRVSSAHAFLAASFGSDLVEGNLRLKTCRRGRFLYMVNDLIGQCLHLYGEWCDHEYEVMQSAVHEGSVVVDVGANIGAFTVPLARQAGSTGKVYALEPQRVVHQLLAANVALNGLTNVHTLQKAGGDGEEDVLWVPDYTAASDRLLNLGARSAVRTPLDDGEAIPCVTVDALGLDRVHLLKIDVEGAELKVLHGALGTIERCRPALHVENNAADGNPELLSLLSELGYRAYWQLTPYYQPANYSGCGFSQHDHFDPSANLWCVPREKAAVVPDHGLPPVRAGKDNWRAAAARGAVR